VVVVLHSRRLWKQIVTRACGKCKYATVQMLVYRYENRKKNMLKPRSSSLLNQPAGPTAAALQCHLQSVSQLQPVNKDVGMELRLTS
jgi:hypothetical protein